MPIHQNNLITYVFPVEWMGHFEYNEEPDDLWGGSELEAFLDDHPNLSYVGCDAESFHTTDHDVPGFEGDSVVCYKYHFSSSGQRRKPVIIGQATKIPFPKETA